uniref:Signal transducer and activator of transcription 2 n=1 Tax=Podarcis muralis TaxID=64176 RepID=A0A670HWY2_PODMU
QWYLWLRGSSLTLIFLLFPPASHPSLIMGFVSRKRERSLLKKKRAGTFLLRFSESTASGGITFTWVFLTSAGSPRFQSVEPYTCVELKSLALPDIIHDYHFLAMEQKSENPLKYLYPDTPRDTAFSPYYSERREGHSDVLHFHVYGPGLYVFSISVISPCRIQPPQGSQG